MLFEKGLCGLKILIDHELAYIGLRPKERERSSDLSVGVYLAFRALISDDDLLELDEVSDESVLVDATMEEPGTTSLSTSPGDQDQAKCAMDLLPVDKTLHKVREPEVADALRLYLLEHVAIPGEVVLDVVLGSEAMLFVQFALPLQVGREIVVVRKVEALFEVLLDLADDIVDLFPVVDVSC